MTALNAFHNLMPMNPASFSFVLVYLPLSLLLYYALPRAAKPAVLFAASAVFLALSEPVSLPVLGLSSYADFLLIRAALSDRVKAFRKPALCVCIVKNLALMGYFAILARINGTPHPFWLFVCCVLGIDAMLAFYRGENSAKLSITSFLNYTLFFPRLYAGPVSGYKNFAPENAEAESRFGEILSGFSRLATGLFKYSIIGGGLFALYNSVKVIYTETPSVLSSWSLVAAVALSLYFTLSGLCDMSRGIAGMFLIKLPQNFYYPYQSISASDFFERFNMTLGNFLKKYVCAPFESEKGGVAADCLKLLLCGALWGMWFGFSLNYALWGMIIAALMIMEKYVYNKLLTKLPTLFCRFYTMLAVTFSFAVFAGDTPRQGINIMSDMLGRGDLRLFDSKILYLLSSNWLLLLSALFFSTSAVSLLTGVVKKVWPVKSRLLFAVIDAGILLLFISLKLGGGFI